MKAAIHYFTMVGSLIIVLLSGSTFAQLYQTQLVNRGEMYATASVIHDYDDDGDQDIVITRRGSVDGVIPPAVEWLENTGTGQFERHELIFDVANPVDISVVDFDDDGLQDYLVASRGTVGVPGELAIFQRQLDGTYIKWPVDSGFRFDQAAIAFFDDDSTLDIVACGATNPTINMYLNNGGFSFQKQEVDSASSEVIAAEDLNNDGNMDVIFGGGQFSAWFNAGNAVFDSSQTLYTWSNAHSSSHSGLVINDLNDDGSMDILTFSLTGLGGLYFLDGALDFQQSVLERDGIDLGGDIVIADMDGNGLKDVIRQHLNKQYVSILYQDSSMVFRRVTLDENWNNRDPGKMDVGDLDGDGDLDLVFPENGNVDGDLAWFENIDGDLHRHYLYSELRDLRIVKIGDLDGDGDEDLAANKAGTDSEIFWYENRGDSGFVEWRIEDIIAGPRDIELADFGSGLEIVATAADDNQLLKYRRDGLGWAKLVIDDAITEPTGAVTVDIDGSGVDIVVCAPGDSGVYWYRNDGDDVFVRQIVDSDLAAAREVEAVDLNDDTFVDLAVVTADTNHSVVIYLNDGNQNFTRTILSSGQLAYDLEIGDWDGNTTLDILACFDVGIGDGSGQDVALFSNDGSANFTGSPLITINERTRALKLIDVDDDSDLDLIFGGLAADSDLQLAFNNGGAVDTTILLSEERIDVLGIDAADINGDLVVDIVAADRFDKNLLLLNGTIATAANNPQSNRIPVGYALLDNYPNPFNPETIIRYQLPQNSKVELVIYDMLGRKVRSLLDSREVAGEHHVTWDGRDNAGNQVTSGVYFYTLSAGSFQKTKKMLLVR